MLYELQGQIKRVTFHNYENGFTIASLKVKGLRKPLERKPLVERLREVDGIGEKRVGMIGEAWSDQKEIREVMVFLQGHGVSPEYYRGLATTISWCLLRRRCIEKRT